MANELDRNTNDLETLDEVENQPEPSGERLGGTAGEDLRGIAEDRDEEVEDTDDLEDDDEEEESDGTV